MMNTVTHITLSGLQLRILKLTDAVALQQLLAENKEHMLPHIAWAVKEPETVEEKQKTIREWLSEFYSDRKYCYGIFEEQTQLLVGLAFLFTRQGENILEIGYLIDYRHWGKGYATACSYALTKLSFELLKIDEVVIICSSLNKASAKIPEKLGYKLEYTYRSSSRDTQNKRIVNLVWALFIEEFVPKTQYEPISFSSSD